MGGVSPSWEIFFTTAISCFQKLWKVKGRRSFPSPRNGTTVPGAGYLEKTLPEYRLAGLAHPDL